jgi:hypothetical protein
MGARHANAAVTARRVVVLSAIITNLIPKVVPEARVDLVPPAVKVAAEVVIGVQWDKRMQE